MPNAYNSYIAESATALTNPTSATCFKMASDSTKPAYVRVPSLTGAVSFRVSAWGLATTGATSNFKATIQYNSDVSPSGIVSAATAANNTDFLALTNRSYATITRSWRIVVDIMWDSTSQRMSGQANGLNAETIETANAAISAATAIDLSTGKYGFVVSTVFGTSNASNVATLSNLSLEVL